MPTGRKGARATTVSWQAWYLLLLNNLMPAKRHLEEGGKTGRQVCVVDIVHSKAQQKGVQRVLKLLAHLALLDLRVAGGAGGCSCIFQQRFQKSL